MTWCRRPCMLSMVSANHRSAARRARADGRMSQDWHWRCLAEPRLGHRSPVAGRLSVCPRNGQQAYPRGGRGRSWMGRAGISQRDVNQMLNIARPYAEDDGKLLPWGLLRDLK